MKLLLSPLLGALLTGPAAPPSPPRATPFLPCLGQQRPIVLAHGMPYLEVRVGGATGRFVLDFGSNTSSLDPAGFSGPAPVPLSGAALAYEQRYDFGGFDLFGPYAKVNLWARPATVTGLGFRQAGIIGTDFFMGAIFTLDYANRRVYRALPGGFCTDEELRRAGFRAASTQGYYADNFQRLLDPDSTINVPTVPVRIGPVTAVAQLDPGYDDSLHPHAVNINQAFFDALREAGVQLRPSGVVDSLSTCVRRNGVVVREAVIGYRLAPADTISITGVDGRPVVISSDAHLFLKKTPPEARSCGGIGTWRIPAAQVGASLLAGARQVIFDPFSSRVWFNAAPPPAPHAAPVLRRSAAPRPARRP